MDDKEDQTFDDFSPQSSESFSTTLEADVPNDLRNLRACLNCSLIKTLEQFEKNGCENCPMNIKGQRALVLEATTTSFEGIISMIDPEKSWVTQWQRIDRRYAKGAYAIAVHGKMPPYLLEGGSSEGNTRSARSGKRQKT